MNSRSVSLSEDFSKVSDRVPLTREALVKVRLRALRRGVWFRELKVGERKLMDLVISIVDKVRSRILAQVLSCIVRRLLAVMQGEVVRLMRTMGRNLAQRLGHIAQVWGNKSALEWGRDLSFVRFVTIMNLSVFRAKKENGE